MRIVLLIQICRVVLILVTGLIRRLLQDFGFCQLKAGEYNDNRALLTRICVVLHKEDREKNETVSPEEDAGEEPRTMLMLITVLRYRDQFCPRTCKVRSWDMGISQYLP